MATFRPHQILAILARHFEGGGLLTEDQGAGSSPGLVDCLKGLGERAPRDSITADYTLTADDEGKVLEVDPDGGTVTITVPVDLLVGYYVEVRQVGTGTVNIVAASGVTIRVVASAADPIAIAEQWGGASVEVRALNDVIVDGRLA